MENDEFQKLVLKSFESINQRFDGIEQRFDGVEQRFDGIEAKLLVHDQRFDGIDAKLFVHDQKFENISSQVTENTQILKALVHVAEVNKAEHDNMSHNIAELSGEIKSMRKALYAVESVTANNWSDIVVLKSVK